MLRIFVTASCLLAVVLVACGSDGDDGKWER